MTYATPHVPDHLLDRARTLSRRAGRRVLGICGPPGAGKSTLAETLRDALNEESPGTAVVVGMDGFHLAQAVLEDLGRASRKGAPDTFDVDGYVVLLSRIRGGEGTVYAPRFERRWEEPVAGAVAVLASCRLVITEGNYLLWDQGRWGDVAALLDEAWYIDPGNDVRRVRLVDRHVEFGRTRVAAEQWVRTTDEPNAALVAATARRADLVWDGRE